nr:hypothetical protein [Tanacetum cinerariifolium]
MVVVNHVMDIIVNRCQPDNQNVDFSGSDQIQTPQYPDVNPPSPEIKYDQSTSTDSLIFLNDNEDHPVQNKESPENSSEETVVSKTNQEPPQDSDIRQLIEECSIKVPEQQKQKMEDMIALDSKLLLINLNSQCLDKKEQEVKNVVEQQAERGNHKSDFVESLLNRDTFIDFSSKFDFSGELTHIKPEIPKSDFDFEEEIRLIDNLLYDNSFSRPPEELNAEIADTIIESIPLLPIPVQDGNSKQEEIDIVTSSDDVLPPSVENDDDSSDDPLLGEADLFLSDNSIPPGIENFADDPEGDIRFLEELPDVIAEEISDKLNKDKCFDPGREINVSTKIEDDDYFPFMFVIRLFLPYFIFPEVSSLLLFAESEDTIIDPEYDQSTRTDRPIFLNNNEDHHVQNKESPENSSEENVVSKTNQEPPQDSDIHQLIEECSIKVHEEQKQKMEDTMFELVKICQEKELLCIHDDVNDLIKSALNFKLFLINLNSQCLDKKEQKVKNVVEQPAEHGNHSIQSLQNFKVVHKSSISFKDTSQISSIHSVAPIQSTKEPEHSLSMGYEHLSIIPETEYDEVTESNAENLLPIPSKCEVTLEDEIECDMPAKDVGSPVFTTFSNPLFKDNDDLDSSNDESLSDEDVPAEEFKIYSNPLFDEDEINSDKLDPHCFNVESDFVESLLNQELNAEIADTIIESIPLLPIPVQDGNSQQEEIDIVTETDDVLPPSDDNDDDLSNDSLLGEADLFLSDNSIPSSIENVADDPEGDIRFLEELLIDDSIISHESYDSNFEDSPSIPRPPSEPPDVESFFDLKPDVIAEEISDKLNEDKCFNPGREINVSTKIEDDDYFPFMFVIRFFLPYFIFLEISPLLLSAESEDTIFDHGLSPDD